MKHLSHQIIHLKTKKEYVYEYLGLKFKLSNKFKKYMNDKKIAMLDDQSPYR